MPAARYWRLAQIETYAAAGLELSEVALYDIGGRVDASASLMATVQPSSGALSSLGDGLFDSSVAWPELAASAPGFALVFDFGAGATKDVTQVGLSGPSQQSFAHRFNLAYSADGVSWSVLLKPEVATKYPGPASLYLLDSATGAPYDVTPVRGRAAGRFSVGDGNVPTTSGVISVTEHFDMNDFGYGRIAGTVKEKSTPANIPLYRRVRLVHQRSGRMIRETWSHPTTGAYAFDWIDASQVYAVESFDHTGLYRAVIADNLTPEAMP